MYMYYLLGFKNLGDVELSDTPQTSCKKHQQRAEIFRRMPESAIAKVWLVEQPVLQLEAVVEKLR